MTIQQLRVATGSTASEADPYFGAFDRFVVPAPSEAAHLLRVPAFNFLNRCHVGANRVASSYRNGVGAQFRAGFLYVKDAEDVEALAASFDVTGYWRDVVQPRRVASLICENDIAEERGLSSDRLQERRSDLEALKALRPTKCHVYWR